jgi:hypothetical protein
MEIKGRECEEIKIGEHTYYFISKFRGKEYRVIQGMVYGQMNLKDKKDEKNMGVFLANIPLLFELLCIQIDDGTIEVSEKFLDNLEMEDYDKVQERVLSGVTSFFTQIK